jgi:biopolymer transport protein ExbB
MTEIFLSGGFLMWPILLCSIIALGIIGERLWSLQSKRVLPAHLTRQVWYWISQDMLDAEHVEAIRRSSPLGRVLAVALESRGQNREVMKESVEDTGRHVAYDMSRYLTSLGTIAEISPLLGLLGTVVGMVNVFNVITTQGIGDPGALADGISQALITTAAGLIVAIPSLIGFRHLQAKVDTLVVGMEQEAIRLVETLQGDRPMPYGVKEGQ